MGNGAALRDGSHGDDHPTGVRRAWAGRHELQSRAPIGSDLVFPYPEPSPEEQERCDRLIAELRSYLRDEHPAVQIDQEERIPEWVMERLFEMGVMGMTIPQEYGGLGLGVTSYNRVL